MSKDDLQWHWKDYTFRANYEGLMLVVNQNNHNWMVQDGNEIVASGVNSFVDGRKNDALNAAAKVKMEAAWHRFFTEEKIEWHVHENEQGKEDVLLLPFYFEMEDLAKLLGTGIFDDDGITCHWKGNYIGVWMTEVCEYFGIDVWEVFKKEEEPR